MAEQLNEQFPWNNTLQDLQREILAWIESSDLNATLRDLYRNIVLEVISDLEKPEDLAFEDVQEIVTKLETLRIAGLEEKLATLSEKVNIREEETFDDLLEQEKYTFITSLGDPKKRQIYIKKYTDTKREDIAFAFATTRVAGAADYRDGVWLWWVVRYFDRMGRA